MPVDDGERMKPQATTEQITALHQEASKASDARVVAICDRALSGSVRALTAVTKLLVGRRHEQAYRAMAAQVMPCDAATRAQLLGK